MPEPETTSVIPWKRQRLRVPLRDETLFARPSLVEAIDLARRNHAELGGSAVDVQGRSLSRLRTWSRDLAYRAALDYTAELLGTPLSEQPYEIMFLGGHQPTLFHPGVWVKNFAIGGLAGRTGGVALNLVIDNDVAAAASLRVPVGTREHPRVELVAYDAARKPRAWEEAIVRDRRMFASFGERVVDKMSRWNIVPLIGEMWDDAVATLDTSPSLGRCFTAARNRLERRWGLDNLELPISRVCRLDPFLWFASHLLAHLPRFHSIHNEVLAEYRQINRIRSRTHPVRALAESDGWLEAPFWTWHDGSNLRRPVLARQSGREVWLSDGDTVFAKLPLAPDMDACCAVEVMRELPARGIRLRTRALTTTLFARLCLADVFVHGIGGAKYDEMTDQIIARFFQTPAPGFLTLTATLHLPIAEPFPVTAADERRLRWLSRDLLHNADRHLTAGIEPAADALVAEKRELIARQQAARADGMSRSQRRRRSPENHARFQRLQEVNRRLAALAVDQSNRAKEDLRSVQQQLEANTVLANREFSFCLFPPEKIRSFMTNVLPP